MRNYYGKAEIERVLAQGRWTSWDQLLRWFSDHEDAQTSDAGLGLSALSAMHEDFSALAAAGENFDPDAASLFKRVCWLREEQGAERCACLAD